MFDSLSVLTTFLLLAELSHAAQYSVHHRVYHPSSRHSSAFRTRGTIDVSGNDAHFTPAPSVADDLALFAQQLDPSVDANKALYQISLQQPGPPSEWSISSVKLCYLTSATAETMYLRLSAEDETPYSLNYFVSPITHHGSCPQDASFVSPLAAFSQQIPLLNTTVILQRPSTPPLPELKTPPPLTADGQVVQPEPEKSFLQKYWIYIAVFFVAILLTGGGEEEGGK